jgi:hypothetical protein
MFVVCNDAAACKPPLFYLYQDRIPDGRLQHHQSYLLQERTPGHKASVVAENAPRLGSVSTIGILGQSSYKSFNLFRLLDRIVYCFRVNLRTISTFSPLSYSAYTHVSRLFITGSKSTMIIVP